MTYEREVYDSGEAEESDEESYFSVDEIDEEFELDDDEEDDEEEPAGPLAEDTPLIRKTKRKGAPVLTEPIEENLDDGPGVRTSGAADVSGMNESERRREFPSVKRRAPNSSPRRRGAKAPARRR